MHEVFGLEGVTAIENEMDPDACAVDASEKFTDDRMSILTHSGLTHDPAIAVHGDFIVTTAEFSNFFEIGFHHRLGFIAVKQRLPCVFPLAIFGAWSDVGLRHHGLAERVILDGDLVAVDGDDLGLNAVDFPLAVFVLASVEANNFDLCANLELARAVSAEGCAIFDEVDELFGFHIRVLLCRSREPPDAVSSLRTRPLNHNLARLSTAKVKLSSEVLDHGMRTMRCSPTRRASWLISNVRHLGVDQRQALACGALPGQCDQSHCGGSPLLPCRCEIMQDVILGPCGQMLLALIAEHCFADFVPTAWAMCIFVGHSGCLLNWLKMPNKAQHPTEGG